MAANWDNYRYFLEVGGHGSLSAAANSLHVSQSTVARRLAGLEKELGVRLLQKTPDAFVLTEAGEGILTRIDTIDDEIHSIVRSISGRDQQHSGRVLQNAPTASSCSWESRAANWAGYLRGSVRISVSHAPSVLFSRKLP